MFGSRLFKILIILFIFGTILEVFLTLAIDRAQGFDATAILFGPSPTPTVTSSPTPSPSPTPTPTPAFGNPVRMSIPAIGVNAPVIPVATDAEGRMEAPGDWFSIGWYAPGTKIGWQGNAVVAGHYDTNTGASGPFFALHKLVAGNEIVITDEIGRTMTYRVERAESRPVGEWNLHEIFGPSDERRLNLVTCAGWWNARQHSYSNRFIVFAKLDTQMNSDK